MKILAQFILRTDVPFRTNLGEFFLVRLKIRLCIDTSKKTDFLSDELSAKFVLIDELEMIIRLDG